METIEVKVTPVPLAGEPKEAMARLRGTGRYALLEIAQPTPQWGEWSYIAGPARATLYTDRQGSWLEREGRVEARWSDPFEALAFMAAQPEAPSIRCHRPDPLPTGLDFVSGWVGVLGYDAARPAAAGEPPLPGMWWMAVDQVLAFHHASGQWWHCTVRGPSDRWPWTGADRPAQWAATLAQACGPRPPRRPWRAGPSTQRMTRERFEAGVQTIRDGIAAGALLQANLTRREDAAFEGDPWSLYEDLAAAHPAPFGAYLEGPGFAIASCSPERFLQLRGRQVQARPIKGTAPRGRTAAEDADQQAWLAASEKNRAENLMIVDLMRNDLGRVAETGSVHVPQLFALEPHAGVWQMVSTVQATLRDGCGAADLLRACWPPGSMTGAPKRAAMQMIDALEPLPRGFYAGAIGYFDCRGGMDLSVVIRTAIVAEGRVMVQAGGGIVADSNAASEWLETVAKAERLLQVIARSGSADPPAG